MEDLIKHLERIAQIVVASGVLITAILGLLGKLREIWNDYLKLFAKWLVCWGSPFILNAVVIWYLLYFAAINANRLWEVGVFLALFAQAALVASLTTFFWGIWLHPKLRGLVKKPEQSSQKKSSAHKKNGERK
jgi:hypothetical protein